MCKKEKKQTASWILNPISLTSLVLTLEMHKITMIAFAENNKKNRSHLLNSKK
jgi:hypothetical protein